MVSAAGAAVAVLMASWIIRLFPALLPPGTSSIMLDLRVDERLVAFAALLGLLSTALVGVIPAWRGSRVDIARGLKTQSATTTGVARGLPLRDVLVVGEIALSGVILIAAGLLVRTFGQSLRISPGFDTRRDVATFYVVPGVKGYDRAATYRFLDEARLSVSALPGVKRVSYAIRLPAQGNEAGWSARVRHSRQGTAGRPASV